LINTKKATHIIADGFMVKQKTLDSRKDELKKLVEGWLKGSAEINDGTDAKKEAATILSQGLGAAMDEAGALEAIGNVRLATHGDNLDFFGLNLEYKEATGQSIYTKMTTVYSRLNLAKGTPDYGSVIDLEFIKSLSVSGKAEEKKVFTAPVKSDETSAAIASKPVKVSFASGSSALDDNAKSLIDMTFVDSAKAFTTSRIRIEGNTDSTGNPENNVKLSKLRAQAVADYLTSAHGFDKNRFVVVGNGPNKPVCNDSGDTCLAKNRRTEFQILQN
jgi:NitT/TauT family transport system substrate-binding protein